MRLRLPRAPTLLGLALLAGAPSLADEADPCAGRGTALVIRSREHAASLCERGRRVARFRVSLGRAGLGKRAAGDDKTPSGTYPLGAPRASASYHTFIPVGYPTRDEKRAGYTGSDIGVHGPPRRWSWLGPLARLADWTRGCIAVSSDGEIDAIAAWVRKRHVVTIAIE